MGWPPNRESQWICDPINLGRGVVPTVFWGKKSCQGWEELYLLDFFHCLEPDG